MGEKVKRRPITVGHTIREYMEEANLSEKGLGQRLGLSDSQTKELLDGDVPITQELAEKLAKVFENEVVFWTARESIYRSQLKMWESKNNGAKK